MKLHILNDLHIEFEDFEPPTTDADVLVLAGDIGVGIEGLRGANPHSPVFEELRSLVKKTVALR